MIEISIGRSNREDEEEVFRGRKIDCKGEGNVNR